MLLKGRWLLYERRTFKKYLLHIVFQLSKFINIFVESWIGKIKILNNLSLQCINITSTNRNTTRQYVLTVS